MNYQVDLKHLDDMVTASVSPFHCIFHSAGLLTDAGYEELTLDTSWNIQKGHSYYVNAFDSTLIAFTVGSDLSRRPSFRIAASHTDWPCLKLKPSPEVTSGQYGRLNVEVYGGPILNTWMDRPLSLAGKVCLIGDSPFAPKTVFVDFKRPLITVPNLPIHVNREVNNGVTYNPQIDMLPLAAMMEESLSKDSYFLDLLAKELDAKKEDILDYEIFVYNYETGTSLGFQNEFYSAPRLDNLTSVSACIDGILDTPKHEEDIHVIALYDNEEIGSHTKQGAASLLMERILEKIYFSLGYDRAGLLDGLMGGFLLSMDVAHAIHPNHSEKYDIKNFLYTGDGVAFKLSASQSYATDSISVSIIEAICRKENIPYKKFSNRSDVKGGSTLGSISSCLLNMRTMDIGVPMLAMHSAREVMCASDQTALVQLTKAFFK